MVKLGAGKCHVVSGSGRHLSYPLGPLHCTGIRHVCCCWLVVIMIAFTVEPVI